MKPRTAIKTAHFQETERGNETRTLEIEILWFWHEGETIEPGNSRNGYGKGWEAETLTAYDAYGAQQTLTEEETESAMQRGRMLREQSDFYEKP